MVLKNTFVRTKSRVPPLGHLHMDASMHFGHVPDMHVPRHAHGLLHTRLKDARRLHSFYAKKFRAPT